ncbi:MAG TPA: tRNA uridine-5-carboxymethylaminomethyl(34) synthesis GTPase MnmE [Steroidobacteraceae bacterium]|nr:tRNA uridine-5-carboxymethylaminomethyl(34) synthesis GTPase MnmE [Steroidobacteraceae bacterium]
MSSPDTIVAIASAPGRGAVGVLRVSGPQVPRIAGALLGTLPAPRLARFGRFRDASGASIDQGIALYFPAPASFTGEEVLELQGHGGALVMDLLMQRVLELGARMARPGEFSERAFLNGKMDVAQAEAVADLIDAATAAAARAAVRSMQGEFSARIATIASLIAELRIHVEAAIDFPDEEIDFLNTPAITSRLARVLHAFDSLEAAARQGTLLRDGLTVVIAGKPNAGKSSLLNVLAGDDVAIVTAAPGTTRDVLRQRVHIDGLPLNLVDTAGLRSAVDPAEQEGVRRARGELQRADRILYVIDASEGRSGGPGSGSAASDALEGLPHGVPVTLVLNKIDLVALPAHADALSSPPRIFLSARSGAGIGLLRAHLKASAGYVEIESGALGARRRHLDALKRARALVDEAGVALRQARTFELFAEDLRLAQRALGEITGEVTNEDLLAAIFASFCIGK